MEFQARVCTDGRLTVIQIPFNAKDVFGKPKGTIFVSGIINGVDYRGKLLSKGSNTQVMVIDKQMQRALGYTGQDLFVDVIMNCEVEPISVIALGYSAEQKEFVERYDPSHIHYQHW